MTVGLRGLRPGTLHHYRLRATSAGGTSLGHDKTLRTPPPDVEKLSVFPASFPVVHGGTTVSYTANAAMTTTFTILRRDRHGHYVSVGSFRHKGRLGRNSLRFSGRLRGRALAPGRYLLRARPRLRGVAGAARQVRFKIIV